MIGLTEIDVKILWFISKNEPADISSIKAEFPNISAIEYRLQQLSQPEYSSRSHIPLDNTSYLDEELLTFHDDAGSLRQRLSGRYTLTAMGHKALQDYRCNKRLHTRELWLKNAWIPIIVSIATNVVLNYILPRLLDLLKW